MIESRGVHAGPACSGWTGHASRWPAVQKRGGVLAWVAVVLLMMGICIAAAGLIVFRTIKVHEAKSGNDVRVDRR